MQRYVERLTHAKLFSELVKSFSEIPKRAFFCVSFWERIFCKILELNLDVARIKSKNC